MIRDFRREDKHAVFTRARQLAKDTYPYLRLDVEKLNDLLIGASARLDHSHYTKVFSNEGCQEVRGALFAMSGDNAWAQRKHCQIMLWYCDTPGGGAALLRDFRQWVKSQRAIRIAGLYHDSEKIDPRALTLVNRVGFKQRGSGAYLLIN